MKKKIVVFALLAFAASMLHAQVGIPGRDGEEGPRLWFTGELLGLYTIGFAADDQLVALPATPLGSMLAPAGVFDNVGNGRNGHMTRMDFGIMFGPVSWVDLYVRLRARSRVGNPYVPLTLEAGAADNFDLSFEDAWGRLNLIEGLGLDMPLDLFVQAGLFSAAPVSFQMISRFGTENVMSRLRLSGDLSVQLEGVFRGATFAESISMTLATGQRFGEGITPLYDSDGSMGDHGQPTIEELYALPLFLAARLGGIETPVGLLHFEAVYALNAEGIYSGNNFGANARFDLELPGLILPIGLAFGMTEKNIDPLARAAHGLGNRNALFLGSGINENHLESYMSTVSFRRSLRIGAGAGVRYSPLPFLATELNLAFSHSQIAHIYRDTLGLNSLSVDMRLTLDGRFFLGGGVFMGTLGDATWSSAATVDGEANPEIGFERVFTLAENMGFELHAGLAMGRSRFVLGYNLNRGLSMGHGIESMSEAQIIHMQPGSSIGDNLFQTGGFFTKLVIAW